MTHIPFNRPVLVGHEFDYIRESIQAGKISGDGPFTKKCHALLEEMLGVPKVLLTTSCTHALEMSALLLDVCPGDEVIIPSFTFVSTVNAFVMRGATPVFADIRSDTLNMDETLLDGLVTKRTKAIVPVHYAGVACEMMEIMGTGERYGIPVVEDNAHGLFGAYRGQPLGTFGALACQSFHETKNVICGEGGALLINDPKLVARAEVLREKGTDRSRFFRGQVDKYTWVDVGSSYLPSDILAAFLFAQLECKQQIQATRERIWHTYDEALTDWAQRNEIRRPVVPKHCDQPFHMYYLLLPDLVARDAFIKHLRKHDIVSVFHYLPLHLSAMGRTFGGQTGDCPVTEEISDRLVRLPLYNDLAPQDQQRVISATMEFVP